MRFTSALPPVLLLSLTTSICAPIPVEECSHYASCTRSVRPSQQSTTQRPKDSSPLQEPHFPTHQLEFSRHADTVEVRLLEPPVTRPDTAIQPEPPIRNPKLNAVLKAAHKDKASAKKKPHELGHKSSSTKGTEVIPAISKTQSPSPKDPDVRKYSFTTSMLKKLQLVASTSRKCGLMDGTAEAEHKHGDGKMTITYTYGYSYIRTDYSSVLVVSIVAIFMLAIIVVELLDKVIEASRAILGLDQGAIRLEDYDCERNDVCPSYTYTPKAFRLMPAPPPRSARLKSQLAQTEVPEEKIQESQDLKSELV